MKLTALVASPTHIPHALLAVEALRKEAELAGHDIAFEMQGEKELDPARIAAADVAIVVADADAEVDLARFAGKPVFSTRTGEAIRETKGVLRAALQLVPRRQGEAAPARPALTVSSSGARKIVAVTSCPTGIAHTFLAAEALKKAAAKLGHEIRVETRGSVGAKNALTDEEIGQADAVIIAAETKVDAAPFAGKRLHMTGTKDAIHHGAEVIETALSLPLPPASGTAAAHSAEAAKAFRPKQRTGPYKHLMTGVSHMLPFVIAGGLAIALAFAVGGIYAGNEKGTVAEALSQIGGGTAFHLFVAVFSGYIAWSIADRPGLAPGFVGGMLAQSLGAGFLGGIISGFVAGYLTKFLADRIRLPATLEGLKPVLILPFLATIAVGLLMIYVVAPPVAAVLGALTSWLNALQGTNAALLGLLLGGMMAFDMGGPVNKAAYTFSVGLLASHVTAPMAAVMAAGMTPPLALGIAAQLFRRHFDEEDRKAAAASFVLGLAFITEGAIPFAAKDPLRVLPALIVGSAVAGAASMLAGVKILVPHGGIFAMVIPGAVEGLAAYAGAITLGTAVTVAGLAILKRPARISDNDAAAPSLN